MKAKNIIFNKISLLAVVGAISVLPAYSAGNGCNNEDNDYINPEIALCTTAAYNIGAISNPTDTAEQEQMKQVIALKTTVITQQMKRQYDYLETTVKRLKTQLEKSILTTNLEAAGATSSDSSSSGGSSSAKSGGGIDGAENCSIIFSMSEKLSCLQRNWQRIYSASGNGTKVNSDVKAQIAADANAINGIKINDGITVTTGAMSKTCLSKTSADKSCIDDLQKQIAILSDSLENRNKQEKK